MNSLQIYSIKTNGTKNGKAFKTEQIKVYYNMIALNNDIGDYEYKKSTGEIDDYQFKCINDKIFKMNAREVMTKMEFGDFIYLMNTLSKEATIK